MRKANWIAICIIPNKEETKEKYVCCACIGKKCTLLLSLNSENPQGCKEEADAEIVKSDSQNVLRHCW